MVIGRFFKKIINSKKDKIINSYKNIVEEINILEPQIRQLSDEKLADKTFFFKEKIKNGSSLDDILVEVFAVVREASVRTLYMRHFDVQLIGGITLHKGKIAEMKTGEGKTLVAISAAYLNALTEKGVHIVTVNDYLAKRDAKWMGQIFEFLKLTVGIVSSQSTNEERKKSYLCDITYVTNNELGFDYLRDNMVFSLEDKVLRDLNYAIVDEVDSILIDEARTPLIISGQVDEQSENYKKINSIITNFKKQIKEDDVIGDFSIDEKHKQIFLTDKGHQKSEKLLQKVGLLKKGTDLYNANNIILMQMLNCALKAHFIYHENIDYIISDDQEIVIIDEFTGRKMIGRRWSEGLHQAIEAKEKVNIKKENKTLASITFQNYFRLYKKISGMTGTAETESFEFQDIYGLEVLVIPTNTSVQRIDYPDMVFKTKKEKYNCIIKDIKDNISIGRPILVGTNNIESSELIYSMLKKTRHKL